MHASIGMLGARGVGKPACRRVELRHEQHQRPRSHAGFFQRRGKQVAHGEHRQGDEEDRALSRCALGPYPPALTHDQFFADVKSQAESLPPCLRRIRRLEQAFEDLLGHAGGDPAAGIGDLQYQQVRVLLEQLRANLHGTIHRREFDGVVEQDDENLRTRVGSAHTSGSSSAMCAESVIPLAAAAPCSVLTA